MMTTADAMVKLGHASVSAAELDILAGRVIGEAVQVTDVAVSLVDYSPGSIATGALLRCAGHARTTTGALQPWSIFVKQLQSARVWPFLAIIPEPMRQEFVESFPWRVEIDCYRSRIAELLPADVRLPVIYDIVEIDSDRAAIWMEDVVPAPGPWSTERFVKAAHALGVLAGRRPVGSDVVFGVAPGSDLANASLRQFAGGRIRTGVGMALDDDAVWRHPALVAALRETGNARIRDELQAAMLRLDEWLAILDALPQTYVHGDASPQNLLVPAQDPDSFVVIDFGFNSPHCVGFDLGQLLVGLAHAGELDPGRLPDLHRQLLPGYVDGLLGTGFAATPAQIERGYVTSLLVRSLFTALPLEMLAAPDSPELRRLLAVRARLARFLLDLAGCI